jgi:hypothetical protein
MVMESVGEIIRGIVRSPWEQLLSRWNWKSALTSALIRGALFFLTNLTAGAKAASGAMLAEFVWRFAVSGFYGAYTQRLRFATPHWAANLMIGLALPVFNHSIEFLIHWTRGTPKLKTSILASVCFTAISMLFNAYAMRQGVYVTGHGSQSLLSDLRQTPRVIGGFLLWLLRLQRSSHNL